MACNVLAFMLLVMPLFSAGLNFTHSKQSAGKNGVKCILVFGDSTVDPGNNNRLATSVKSNFPPYGKNFISGLPTGRFTNGRLATDFFAESLGIKSFIPPFLDPILKKADLLTGVSFASAGSGYDDLTANLSNVLTLSQQLDYFQHYKYHLRRTVGSSHEARRIINHAIFVLSMGTNDFVMNYYLDPTRPKQFTIDRYQDFLISKMVRRIKTLSASAARKLILVGLPPMGCLPIVTTLKDVHHGCFEELNEIAASFNHRIKKTITSLRLEMKIAYVDIYNTILTAIKNPKSFGFLETSRGCCGTGLTEFGEGCKGLTTCPDPEKYVFWDAVHPTEKMYKICSDTLAEAS
ncbi:hypothetical protein QQ045_006454 [Rhodiola kirilowii]